MAPVLGVPLTSAGCLTGDACSRRCSGLAFPHRSSWAWGVKVQPPVSWLGRFQDYFRAAVVESYGAVNLDDASSEKRRTSPTSLRSDAKTTTENGHAACCSRKPMKWTPFAPAYTRKILPVMHLVSPKCWAAL
jgi:hypothetical protein